MLLKRFAPLNVGHVQTTLLQYATVWLTSFVLLWIAIQFGDDKVFCFSQCWSMRKTDSGMRYCVQSRIKG